MILTAIKYNNLFFSHFEEIEIKNGYGGHGIGVGIWKDFEPVFVKKPIYFTKRSLGDKINIIIKSMQNNIISLNNIELITKSA